MRLKVRLEEAQQEVSDLIRLGEELLETDPPSFMEMTETMSRMRSWDAESKEVLRQISGTEELARQFSKVRTSLMPADAGAGPKYEQLIDITRQKVETLRTILSALNKLAADKNLSRSVRDPYPTTLQAVRDDIDYWATRQHEGEQGSDWEISVQNRLTQLRSLESRFKDEQDQAPAGRGARLSENFYTAFETYSRLEQAGAGGAGRVFKVRDSEGNPFALKLLNPEAGTTKAKRFKNELMFCLKNAHRNIVNVLDYGVSSIGEKRVPFYVMPFYSSTLRKLCDAGIHPDRVLPLFTQVLDGVEAAHERKVWHRDLKPENILYEPASDTVVVADFGIADFTEDELFTAVETGDQERLANFLYSAPEQRARGREVDGRADIFALGLILNEMFTGRVPQGAGFRRIADVVPRYGYFDATVDAMTQQDPESRPPDITSVKNGLRLSE